jgi:serine O-acetyltransferase
MNAINLYRIGNFFHRMKIPFIPKVFELLIRLLFNSVIYSETKIGKGTKLAYGGIAVVIHKKTVIGSNVIISQCVTIGGRSNHKELPIIKDNVYIGAGAKILGPVVIEEGAVIGANAVVIKDVLQRSVVAGVPAKIIKKI